VIFDVAKLARKLIYPLSALVGLALVCLLAFSGGCLTERWQFTRLQAVSEDTEKAEQLARHLRSTERGVHLALNDMNCYGGKTRGWSSWILETSPLSSEVESRLRRITDDTSQGLPRRVEAAIILWQRTSDPDWLIQCYQFVQKAGGPTIAMGRKRLAASTDFGDLRAQIDVPASEDARASTNGLFEFVSTNKFTFRTNRPRLSPR